MVKENKKFKKVVKDDYLWLSLLPLIILLVLSEFVIADIWKGKGESFFLFFLFFANAITIIILIIISAETSRNREVYWEEIKENKIMD